MSPLFRTRKAKPEKPEPRGPKPRDRGSVLALLREFVVAQSDQPLSPAQVDPTISLLEEGVLDSYGSVQLLVDVEETWGLAIDESELVGQLHCLDLLADFIVANTRDPS